MRKFPAVTYLYLRGSLCPSPSLTEEETAPQESSEKGGARSGAAAAGMAVEPEGRSITWST